MNYQHYREFTTPNQNGDTLQVWLQKCEPDNTSKHSSPNLWKEHGYIDHVLATYWHVETEAHNDDGNWRFYDPSMKETPDHKRNVINFDYMLEATEENAEIILQEVARMFHNGQRHK